MEGLIGPLWGRIFGVHAAALDGGITFTMLQTEDDDDDDDVYACKVFIVLVGKLSVCIEVPPT